MAKKTNVGGKSIIIEQGFEKTKDYPIRSKESFNTKFSKALEPKQLLDGKVTSALSNIGSVVSKALTAGKLILADAGMVRQLIPPAWGRSRSQDYYKDKDNLANRKNKSLKNGEINTYTNLDRFDIESESVFKIGNFWLPLSITYKVSGAKKLAHSQLVDGINIIERVAISPLTVMVNISARRRPESVNNVNSTVTSADVPSLGTELMILDSSIQGDTVFDQAMITFANIFTSLYNANEVFELENKLINRELGVNTFIMESFSIEPKRGCELIDITMSLLEVNTKEQIIEDDSQQNETTLEVS